MSSVKERITKKCHSDPRVTIDMIHNELIRDIKHSLVADCGLSLSEELEIVNESEGVCYRATYIVDGGDIIQHVSVNELDTGRNVEEIIRTVKALQAGGKTGCDWEPGDDLL